MWVQTKKGGKRRINGEKNGEKNGELFNSPFAVNSPFNITINDANNQRRINGELTAN